MQQILQTVKCTLPGFEGVSLTFDLATPEEAADKFYRAIGGKGTHEGLVVSVEGWPGGEYGPDPWHAGAPVIFRAWASRKGWALAIKEYLDDPN